MNLIGTTSIWSGVLSTLAINRDIRPVPTTGVIAVRIIIATKLRIEAEIMVTRIMSTWASTSITSAKGSSEATAMAMTASRSMDLTLAESGAWWAVS